MTTKQTATSIFRRLGKGEALFREGEPSDFIYYVVQGKLEVFTETEGEKTALGNVNADEFVGEFGVLQNTVRNASVYALTETHIKQHNKWAFIDIISQDPENSIKLLYSLSFRTHNVGLLINQIDKQIIEHKHAFSLNPVQVILSSTSRAFRYIKKILHKRDYSRYKKNLSSKLQNGTHEIKQDNALFCEGEESHYACRVLSGKFKVLKSLDNRHENFGIIKPGEFIGEIGLLEDAPRSLTIVALTDSQVEVFDEDSFLKTVCSDGAHCYELIKNLSRRATELNLRLKELTNKYASMLNASTLMQAKQLVWNVGDVSVLTGRVLENDLNKLKQALKLEAVAVHGMLETYYRYINGDASKDEMDLANAEFRNFLKTLGLGALIIIPGSFITIPVIVKMAKSVGIDILPKSRSNV